MSLSVCLSFSPALAQAASTKSADETPASGGTINITVTLSGITSFKDYQEIKSGLQKSEGVDKLNLETEAPGLITLSMKYAGETRSLINQLSEVFLKKYSLKEKQLSSGGTEVTISKMGS